MNIPDNLDDLLGSDDVMECLQEVASGDAKEILIIWIKPDDEYINWICSGMVESKALWMLEKVKQAILE